MRIGILALLFVAPIAQAQSDLVEWSRINGTDAVHAQAPVVVPSGGGAVTFHATRVDFDAVVPTQTCEDFEDGNVNDGDIIGFPSPLNAATNNAQFPTGSIAAGIEFSDNPVNDAGGGSANGLVAVGATAFGTPSDIVLANTFVDSFDIRLSPATTGIAMDVFSFTAGGTATVSFFDAGDVMIGSTTVAATPSVGGFVGATSSTPIARVNIDSIAATSAEEAEGGDNICFGTAGGAGLLPVPQPNVIPATDYTGLGIMALLLGLLGLLVWRSRS